MLFLERKKLNKSIIVMKFLLFFEEIKKIEN